MRIGDLSRRSGVSVRMLRYYEKQGLVRPGRCTSGYRDYHEADLVTVRRIRVLNAAGLKLATIRRILPCAREGVLDFSPCAEFRSSLNRHIAELDARLGELAESRRVLADLLATT